MGDKREVEITGSTAFEKDELYGKFYKCPHCGDKTIHTQFKYCPTCGYKVKWSTETRN